MNRAPSLRPRVATKRGAAAFVIAVVLFTACGGASAPDATALALTKGPLVDLKGLVFKPNKLAVKRGETVTWVWREKVAHNVVFADKIKSKILSKGTYTRTFDKAGTFKYVCALHPGMKGEISVK